MDWTNKKQNSILTQMGSANQMMNDMSAEAPVSEFKRKALNSFSPSLLS